MHLSIDDWQNSINILTHQVLLLIIKKFFDPVITVSNNPDFIGIPRKYYQTDLSISYLKTMFATLVHHLLSLDYQVPNLFAHQFVVQKVSAIVLVYFQILAGIRLELF